MQTTSNNIPSIQPSSRKDLSDFFRQTHQHFPGYIKQAIFRDKLVRIVSQAYHASIRQSVTDAQASIFLKVDFGAFIQRILDDTSKEEWRPIGQLRMTTSQEKYDEARQYLIAAAGGVVVDKVAGKVSDLKIVKNGIDKVANFSSKELKKVKVINDTKRDKIISAMYSMNESKAFDRKPQSVSQVMIGKAVGGAANGAESSLSKKKNKVEPFQLQFSSNKKADWTIDLVTDFIPLTTTTKMVTNALGNTYMGCLMLYEAAQTRKIELEAAQFSKDLNAKIRRCIADDFKSFYPKDLVNLVNFLGIK